MREKKPVGTICLCAVMALLGLFYILSAGGFGKALPAYWGIAAVPLALALLWSLSALHAWKKEGTA